MKFRDDVKVQLEVFGLKPTDKQIDQFCSYYDYLLEINEVMNLTAITEAHEVAIKHMVDSLSCYDKKYFVEGAKVLDLGSGAGFPGIPLAIWDTSLAITLFDSLQKRLHFLTEVGHRLGLASIATLHGRAEDKAHEEAHREAYDIVTSRAVARLPILAEWALPYVKVGGYFVALKGAAYEEEIEEAKKALAILGAEIAEVRPISLPTLHDKRAILYIKKVKACGKKYPRKPKEIKAKPL